MLFYVDWFCACLYRQVYCFALFYVNICAFLCLRVERFMQLCRDIQSRYIHVYSILMYIFWLAKRYSTLITHFTRIIGRVWTLRIYKYVIISGRYTARKQWKLYIINMKMATHPYIIGILILHLIPSTLIKT